MYYNMNLSVSFHCIPPCEVTQNSFFEFIFFIPKRKLKITEVKKLNAVSWQASERTVLWTQVHLILWLALLTTTLNCFFGGWGPNLWEQLKLKRAIFLLLRVCAFVCCFCLYTWSSYFPCAKLSWAATVITSFSDSFWKILFQSFISVCGCGWSWVF